MLIVWNFVLLCFGVSEDTCGLGMGRNGGICCCGGLGMLWENFFVVYEVV